MFPNRRPVDIVARKNRKFASAAVMKVTGGSRVGRTVPARETVTRLVACDKKKPGPSRGPVGECRRGGRQTSEGNLLRQRRLWEDIHPPSQRDRTMLGVFALSNATARMSAMRRRGCEKTAQAVSRFAWRDRDKRDAASVSADACDACRGHADDDDAAARGDANAYAVRPADRRQHARADDARHAHDDGCASSARAHAHDRAAR